MRKKLPSWRISEAKYLAFFGELPREYLEERDAYDRLVEISKTYKRLHLVLTDTKIEVRLSIDQLILWEIARFEDAGFHKISVGDVKKELKEV